MVGRLTVNAAPGVADAVGLKESTQAEYFFAHGDSGLLFKNDKGKETFVKGT